MLGFADQPGYGPILEAQLGLGAERPVWTPSLTGASSAPPVGEPSAPVRWDGNGHYYQAVYVSQGIGWAEARDAAQGAGGYLATPVSAVENQFVLSLVMDDKFWFYRTGQGFYWGPWLGGYQKPGSPEPSGGWSWVTGEQWSWANWAPSEPSNGEAPNEDALHFFVHSSQTRATCGWNDANHTLHGADRVYGYVIEYNSDPSVGPGLGLANSPWPTFQRTAQRTGITTLLGPSNPVKQWEFATGGAVYCYPTVGPDGTVYFGSSDGKLYAVTRSGALRWSFTTGAGVYFSSPTIAADGTIYFNSYDGYLYALGPDGTMKWRFETGGTHSSPVVGNDGTVYTSLSANGVCALGADGVQRWVFSTSGVVQGAPALGVDGTVYAASTAGLYAIRPDGAFHWWRPGSSFYGTPSVAPDGTVYAGDWNGVLHAVTPDGILKWSVALGIWLLGSPAVGPDGTIYQTSRSSGRLYAVSPSGTVRWSFATGAEIYSSPAIGGDGTIYFGSRDGKVYAVNPDGTKLWDYVIGDTVSSPAIGEDRTLYIGSMAGKLHAITDVGSGAGLAKSAWPKFRANAGNTGLSPYAGPQTATLKWVFDTGDRVLSNPVMGADGTVYVGCYSGLHAMDPAGTLKWVFRTGGVINASPAIGADGTLYVGSTDRNLYAITPGGAEKWRLPMGGTVNSGPAIREDGTIYVGCYDNNLYAVRPDGTVDWRFATGGLVESSPAISPDGTVYVGSLDRCVYAVNRDGTQRWRFVTGSTVESSPTIAADGTVYVGSNDSYFYALNPDGTQKWRFKTRNWVFTNAAIGADGTVYIGCYDGYVYALSPDGSLRWEVSLGRRVDGSAAIGADGTIYVGTNGGSYCVYALNPDGTIKWGLALGTQGQPSPAIGADGTLYVGMDPYICAIADAGQVDLQVTSVEAPTLAEPGSVVSVQWAVRNAGSRDAGVQEWYDRVYLSPSITFDPSTAADLGAKLHYGGLAAGGTYTDSRNVTIPAATALGHCYIIVRTDAADTQPESVESNNSCATPIEVGGTEQIVFYSGRDGNYEIYRMGADGSDQTRLTNDPSEDYSPDISPDGTRVAFVSTRSGGHQIWVMDSDGMNPRQLTSTGGNATGPEWSPDGARIAFASGSDVNARIAIINSDGSGLVVHGVYSVQPTWSPDGTRLAIQQWGGGWHTHIMNSDGTCDTHLSSTYAGSPAWSPDGLWIAFGSGSSGIGAVRPDGSGEHTVVTGTCWEPTWSPDASHLAFSRQTSGHYKISTAGADGADLRQLTTGSYEDFGPDWCVLRTPTGREADLAATQVTATDTCAPGDTVHVGWDVANAGTAPVGPEWTDSVYLSPTSSFDPVTAVLLATKDQSTVLDPGANYTDSADVTIPGSVAVGGSSLIVVTDSGGIVAESDETNNSAAAAITVRGSDLTVSSLSVPTQARLGESVHVAWTVANEETARTNADAWVDRVLLQTTPSLDLATATELGSVPHAGVLEGGAIYSASLDAAIPAGAGVGQHYVFVVTDAGGAVSETDEGNNSASQAVQVVAPNLVPTSLLVPPTVAPAEPAEFRFTVANQGDAATPQGVWHDCLYLSTSAAFDPISATLLVTLNAGGTLSPGESYSTSRLVVLPRDLAPGTYYASIYTDEDQSVVESNEQDNVLGVPLQIVPPRSDLVVSSVTCPMVLRPAESFTVGWGVFNGGTSTTLTGAWVDRVFASADDSLDPASDTLLGNFVHSGVLRAGEGYSMAGAVRLPRATALGPIWVFVFTDADDALEEADDWTNNIGTPGEGQVVQSEANLTPSAVVAPDRALLGAPISVSWIVGNTGTESTIPDAWTDRLLLSSVPAIDSSTISLSSRSHTGVLQPGQSYSAAVSATIPKDLAAGTYYVGVFADAGDDVPENDEDDNVAWSGPVAIGTCDLVVSDLTHPAELWSSAACDVSWVVDNVGTLHAEPSWVDRVWLSTTPQPGGTELGRFTFVGRLEPGTGYKHTHRVTVPRGVDGDYYLVVKTDADGSVAESDEANNVRASAVSVHLSPAPDLIVPEVVVPDRAFAGQDIGIRFRVANQGTAPSEPAGWSDRVWMSFGDVLDGTSRLLRDLVSPVVLAPGESYDQVLSTTLDRALSGDRYFHVKADNSGTVYESDESNNLGVSNKLTVDLPPLPDLAVTKVTCPPAGWSGQLIDVKWTVQNIGVAATREGRWTDAVYLYDQEVLDPSKAYRLGTFTHLGDLEPNGSYSMEQSVTLPNGVSGSYYVFVVTDSGKITLDFNDTNNTGRGGPIQITMTPPPDLVVEVVEAPPGAVAGAPFTVQWWAANRGPGATVNSSWYDGIYLSTEETFSSTTAVKIGQLLHTGKLEPDVTESYSASMSVAAPRSLPAGDYFLHVFTDNLNWEYEWEYEGNNVRTVPIVLRQTGADLQVTSVEAPTEATGGQAVGFQWSVTNAGTEDTISSAWTDHIYLSLTDPLGSGAIQLAATPHGGVVPAGASYRAEALVRLDPDLSGTYYVFAWADRNDQVIETNENNNVARAAGTITITPAPRPDLVVSSATAPPSATAGDRISISWSVNNVGSAATWVNSWYDSVYLSASQTLDMNSASRLGTFFHGGTLEPGAGYTQERDVIVPGGLASGTYYLFFVADSGGGVVELSDGNNTRRLDIGIQGAPETDHPDLQVDFLEAPDTAQAGQTVTVSARIANGGSVDVGKQGWYDGLYLSKDDFFNGSATSVAQTGHSGPVAAGGTYDTTFRFDLPRDAEGTYYLFVVSDSGANVTEANESNNVSANHRIDVSPAELTDLAVTSVGGPGTALMGRQASFTWTVQHLGSVGLKGSWTDGVYLSTDAQWDSSDVCVGYWQFEGGLAPNGEYQGHLTAMVPGMAPGPYYVIARCDVKQQVKDRDRRNNVGVSATTTVVDAIELTLGEPYVAKIAQSAKHYYKVNVPAGEDLSIAVDANDKAITGLFASYDTVPSLSSYQFIGEPPFAADHEIIVPTTNEGWYYILVDGQSIPEPTMAYSILARLLPFGVRSITPNVGGNVGPVTCEILGSQFRDGMELSLLQGETVIVGRNTVLESSSVLYTTFDLAGVPTGRYHLHVKRSDGLELVISDAFTVVAGRGGRFVARLQVPDRVNTGGGFLAVIRYGNIGDTDLPAPLLILRADQSVPMRLSPSGIAELGGIQILALGSGGDAKVIRPGSWGQVLVLAEMPALEPHAMVHFRLLSQAANGESLPWAEMHSNITAAFPLLDWPTMEEALRAHIGGTWGTYLQALAALSRTVTNEDVCDPRCVRELWVIVLVDALSDAEGTGDEVGFAAALGPPESDGTSVVAIAGGDAR